MNSCKQIFKETSSGSIVFNRCISSQFIQFTGLLHTSAGGAIGHPTAVEETYFLISCTNSSPQYHKLHNKINVVTH